MRTAAGLGDMTDIKILSDKPSQLKDGTPAREVQFEFVPKYDSTRFHVKNSPKWNDLLLATKKDWIWVAIFVGAEGNLGEDVKSIAYSLTFLQGREEPVKVPPDVRAFLDMYCADVVGHDVKTIMAHFSDRFLLSGGSKASMEFIFSE